MAATITIEAEEELKSALEDRAAHAGKTVSEFVHDLVSAAINGDDAVEAQGHNPRWERIKHLSGCSDEPDPTDEWSLKIRERNWRS